MGFSKNPFSDPSDDLERRQTSPRAPLMAVGAYRVDSWFNTRVFINIIIIISVCRLRSVGKLYGGHQATVISLAVGDTAVTSSPGSCAVTGSKDRCLKVHAVELSFNVYHYQLETVID